MPEQNDIRDDLIDRYLRQTLDADELAQFEIRMLEDPLLFDAVQQADLMQQGFDAQPAPMGHASKQSRNSGRADITYLPFRHWIRQPLSMAASLTLAIAVGILAVGGDPEQITDNQMGGYAVHSVINLSQTRSSSNEITVAAEVHLLQIDVGISLSEVLYHLQLNEESSNRQYDFQVRPDSNGVVRLLTPAGLQGAYTLRIWQQGMENESISFQLRFN